MHAEDAVEGTAFRVYKLDIASFYESVRLQQIFEQAETDIDFSANRSELFDRSLTNLVQPASEACREEFHLAPLWQNPPSARL